MGTAVFRPSVSCTLPIIVCATEGYIHNFILGQSIVLHVPLRKDDPFSFHPDKTYTTYLVTCQPQRYCCQRIGGGGSSTSRHNGRELFGARPCRHGNVAAVVGCSEEVVGSGPVSGDQNCDQSSVTAVGDIAIANRSHVVSIHPLSGPLTDQTWRLNHPRKRDCEYLQRLCSAANNQSKPVLRSCGASPQSGSCH